MAGFGWGFLSGVLTLIFGILGFVWIDEYFHIRTHTFWARRPIRYSTWIHDLREGKIKKWPAKYVATLHNEDRQEFIRSYMIGKIKRGEA